MPHLLKKVQKTRWKLWKSLISRAQKRWAHQGRVELKEPMSQHLPPTSVPKSNAKTWRNLWKSWPGNSTDIRERFNPKNQCRKHFIVPHFLKETQNTWSNLWKSSSSRPDNNNSNPKKVSLENKNLRIFIDQVFCVSFRKSGTMKMLRHWFFELNPSLMSVLFPGRELKEFYRFHQVFLSFDLDLRHKKGVDRLVLKIGPHLVGAISSQLMGNMGSSLLPQGFLNFILDMRYN